MKEELYNIALSFAKTKSYSPYSNIKVGAAALLSNGEVVCGTNLENASYPVCICAEQSLLSTVNNLHGKTKIEIIAVAAVKDGNVFSISPCGMCRQALLEWENRLDNKIKVVFMQENKLVIVDSVRELLPYAFSSL